MRQNSKIYIANLKYVFTIAILRDILCLDGKGEQKMTDNMKKPDIVIFTHYKTNNPIEKLSRYDRFVDTSSKLSIEDTAKIKVDRVDRM